MPQSRIPLSASVISAARKQFLKDPNLAPLIKRFDPPRSGGRKDPFHSLIVAIINQQISLTAAAAIEKRLAEAFGRPFAPDHLLSAKEDELRSCGVSRSKAQCIKACALDASRDELSAASCAKLSDEQIAERLIAIKGIGLWSTHMVLLFGLGRPDIMPDGDGGIQRSAKLLFNSRTYATAHRRLLAEAKRWQPYRSVAAWYLWRQLG